MPKSKTRITKHTVTTDMNEPHSATRIPSVGGKLFRRTSESADFGK